jgi:DNA-binding NarL/FixJ family response regulator
MTGSRRSDIVTAVKTRLIVADDSPPFLELLMLALSQMPDLDLVGAAVDGREAVRMAVDRDADAVLLDVEMPGLDGFAAAQEIRRFRPHAHLVLHTGAFVDEHRRRAEDLNLRLFDKLELWRTIDVLQGFSRSSADLLV